MNTEREPTEDAGEARPAGRHIDSLSANAADRRRLLLKGVGRGGALLAATVPLKTLAGPSYPNIKFVTVGKTQCSASGMQSGFHSVSTATTCGGKTISYWCNNFPSSLPNKCTSATKCNVVFGSSCTLKNSWGWSATLLQALSDNNCRNTADAHWVCAWLNACVYGGTTFPYAPAEVVAFYTDANKGSAAYGLFTKYLES